MNSFLYLNEKKKRKMRMFMMILWKFTNTHTMLAVNSWAWRARVIVVVIRLLLFAVHFTVKSSKNFYSFFVVISSWSCAWLKILNYLFAEKVRKINKNFFEVKICWMKMSRGVKNVLLHWVDVPPYGKWIFWRWFLLWIF